MGASAEALDDLQRSWSEKWPQALNLWSRFTKLREPVWCRTAFEEKKESLTSSFAMTRLDDQQVVISLRQIHEQHLDNFQLEVMGHEIGHHVYCPADLADQGRLIARLRRGLPTKEKMAPLVGNLYTDLLINDRLQREAGLRMGEVYKTLASGSADRMWTFYMRIYEILWNVPKGSLATGTIDAALDTDAGLGARLIRVYARDWLKGAGRFAALCFDYLKDNDGEGVRKALRGWLDSEHGGHGLPDGLTEIDDDEIDGAIHPSLDPEISGIDDDSDGLGTGRAKRGGTEPPQRYRDPAEYREILRSLGVEVDDAELTAKYYRERAIPHLVRFPVRELPEASEPLAEGLDSWEAGESLDQLDIFESLLRSDVVIPGVTTVQRTYGTTEGSEVERQPVDLYLGIDCSGSMSNPALQMSFPVLAGTIIALSALRAGARVMVTLSGEPGLFSSTEGFIRDEKVILKILTGYLGTGYAFGIHHLADVFPREEKKNSRPVHIMIVTDSDIFHMLSETQKGKKGWTVAAEAVVDARGGGTYVLHMQPDHQPQECQLMKKDGWDLAFVADWEDIVAFAREFSRKNYGATDTDRRGDRAPRPL